MAGIILAHALEVMDRPWKWGEADCCTAACDVFLRLTGIDAMAPLRGQYDTFRGAAALIQARGGFEAMCDGLAAAAGLSSVMEGAPGDLAVGSMPGDRFALTICIASSIYLGKTLTGMATIHRATRHYRA